MPEDALRAREDRVVVGHDHRALAVHISDARDQAVRRRALHQLLARPPTLLRREHERPVLDKSALIDQLAHVLPCGPAAARVALVDRVLAGGVECLLVAAADRG